MIFDFPQSGDKGPVRYDNGKLVEKVSEAAMENIIYLDTSPREEILVNGRGVPEQVEVFDGIC